MTGPFVSRHKRKPRTCFKQWLKIEIHYSNGHDNVYNNEIKDNSNMTNTTVCGRKMLTCKHWHKEYRLSQSSMYYSICSNLNRWHTRMPFKKSTNRNVNRKKMLDWSQNIDSRTLFHPKPVRLQSSVKLIRQKVDNPKSEHRHLIRQSPACRLGKKIAASAVYSGPNIAQCLGSMPKALRPYFHFKWWDFHSIKR